jgi:amidohydrolase
MIVAHTTHASNRFRRYTARTMHHLTTLRQDLHTHPEVSGFEHATHDRIAAYLRANAPGIEIIEHIAETGLAAVISHGSCSRTLIYRADTDALPIDEQTDLPYASRTPGTMHACGHDGHAAIAAGLAQHFAAAPIPNTRLIVLFQPAEEIGTGAQAVLEDPAFTQLISDPASTRVLAIHNLPGYPLGQLAIRTGPMCPASIGLRLVLSGVAGHSSQPALSRSPLPAAASLVQWLIELPKRMDRPNTLITVTHLSAGIDANFGITPDHAVLCATLRAMSAEHLDALLKHTLQLATRLAQDNGLTLEHTTHEHYAATINDDDIAQRTLEIANAHDLDSIVLDNPMPWSEDFGRFTDTFPGMLLGIGAGQAQPHLHANTYDFPDDLIPIAVNALATIMSNI